ERVLLLAVGLILGGAGWLLWTIAALAITSTFTAIQRIAHVWLLLAREAASPSPTDSKASTNRVDHERAGLRPTRPSGPRGSSTASVRNVRRGSPPSAQ